MMNRRVDGISLLEKVPSLTTNKANRFAKIAIAKTQRIVAKGKAPFLVFEILYLRRDMAYMSKKDLQRTVDLLDSIADEVCFKKNKKKKRKEKEKYTGNHASTA